MKLDAAHKLESYKGKCHNLHGHTYNVFVLQNMQKGELPENNMLIDFKDLRETPILKDTHQQIEAAFDHQYLNEVLQTKDPTAEIMAKKIYDDFIRGKPNEEKLSVMVMETENSVAIYDGKTFWLSASKK